MHLAPTVAPFTGAWIETAQEAIKRIEDYYVAPFTGAWIETGDGMLVQATYARRALHGRVD